MNKKTYKKFIEAKRKGKPTWSPDNMKRIHEYNEKMKIREDLEKFKDYAIYEGKHEFLLIAEIPAVEWDCRLVGDKVIIDNLIDEEANYDPFKEYERITKHNNYNLLEMGNADFDPAYIRKEICVKSFIDKVNRGNGIRINSVDKNGKTYIYLHFKKKEEPSKVIGKWNGCEVFLKPGHAKEGK